MMVEHLVITGRSGAGVSTTAVNLSAALAEQGYRIAHLGYDRRRVSSQVLRGKAPLRAACGNSCKEPCNDEKFLCAIGVHDILCIECGVDEEVDAAPEFAALRRMELITRFRPDFVVHDLAGEPDTVLPFLRNAGEPMRLFVVTSAEFTALTTLNLYLDAVACQPFPDLRIGGVVANNLSGPFFEMLVADFTSQAGMKPMVSIPHSLMVSVGEFSGMTVLESAPHSHLGSVYRKLARLAVQGGQGGQVAAPQALNPAAFVRWQRKWAEIAEELESGLVRDGAAI